MMIPGAHIRIFPQNHLCSSPSYLCSSVSKGLNGSRQFLPYFLRTHPRLSASNGLSCRLHFSSILPSKPSAFICPLFAFICDLRFALIPGIYSLLFMFHIILGGGRPRGSPLRLIYVSHNFGWRANAVRPYGFFHQNHLCSSLSYLCSSVVNGLISIND
jgi:hypothetical protein